MSSEKTHHLMSSLMTVIVGNFLYALTVKLFLLPGGLVTGGTTGIALTMNHFWGIPISGFVLFFNIVMLIVGWLALGKAFAATTLASSFLYPIFLEVCNQIFGDMVLTNDLILNTIFCGIGIGVSLGMVIRSGASTGGMDIPPLILKKTMRIPVSASLYFFDGCILVLQMLYRPADNVLYGIVLMLVYTTVLDKMLMIGSSRTELKIVSSCSKEICEAILKEVDRGVTLLQGEGGYLHKDTQVILSVISNRELVKVERLVRKIDPECFMVVSRVSEVRGRGFSLSKYYQNPDK